MREEIELMRILRVPPLGKLVIQEGGSRYETLSEVQDERLRRRIITAIGELMGFAGGYQALVDEGVAPPLAAQTPSGGLQSKAAALKEQQERFLEQLEQQKAETVQANKSRTLPQVTADTVEHIEKEPVSLIKQIDAILQRHISSSDRYRDRSIHLIQGAEGNVKIEVDGRVYDRPRDIDEKPIQLMIKKALKEWEAS